MPRRIKRKNDQPRRHARRNRNHRNPAGLPAARHVQQRAHEHRPGHNRKTLVDVLRISGIERDPVHPHPERKPDETASRHQHCSPEHLPCHRIGVEQISQSA